MSLILFVVDISSKININYIQLFNDFLFFLNKNNSLKIEIKIY